MRKDLCWILDGFSNANIRRFECILGRINFGVYDLFHRPSSPNKAQSSLAPKGFTSRVESSLFGSESEIPRQLSGLTSTWVGSRHHGNCSHRPALNLLFASYSLTSLPLHLPRFSFLRSFVIRVISHPLEGRLSICMLHTSWGIA